MSRFRKTIAAFSIVASSAIAALARAEFLHTAFRNDGIVRIDEVTGHVLGEFANFVDGFESFSGLTIGPDRLLYVSAFNHNTSVNGNFGIYRFDLRSGQFINTFIPNVRLFGGEFSSDGNFYALASLTRDLREFDGTTGIYKRTVLSAPQSYVSAFTVSPQGDLFAVTGGKTLARYDLASGVQLGPVTDLSTIGLTGYGFDTLAIGPDGNLYASYNYLGRDKQLPGGVMSFDGRTGDFARTIIDNVPAFGAASGGQLGLAFGPDGDLFVGSQFAKAILRYNPTTWQQVGQYPMTRLVEGAESIVFLPLPEQSTAALLGSGLLAMTIAGAARRSRSMKFSSEIAYRRGS